MRVLWKRYRRLWAPQQATVHDLASHTPSRRWTTRSLRKEDLGIQSNSGLYRRNLYCILIASGSHLSYYRVFNSSSLRLCASAHISASAFSHGCFPLVLTFSVDFLYTRWWCSEMQHLRVWPSWNGKLLSSSLVGCVAMNGTDMGQSREALQSLVLFYHRYDTGSIQSAIVAPMI